MSGQVILIFIAGLGVGSVAAAQVLGRRGRAGYGILPDWAFVTSLLGTVIAVIFGGVALGVGLTSRHDQTVCAVFGREAGREVTFAHYTYFSWECLVRTGDGLLPREQVILVEEAP